MNLLVVISFPLTGVLIAFMLAWWETRPAQVSSGPFDWELQAPDHPGAEVIQLRR